MGCYDDELKEWESPSLAVGIGRNISDLHII